MFVPVLRSHFQQAVIFVCQVEIMERSCRIQYIFAQENAPGIQMLFKLLGDHAFNNQKRRIGIMRHFVAFLLLLFLSSCSSVVSQYPVGLEDHSIVADEWNGTWLNENEIVKIHVIDQSKGIIEIAWIEHSQEAFKFESMTCQLRKGKNWLYANVMDIPNEKVEGYYWGKLKKEEKKILLWLPSVEAFRQAAETGQIDAVVDVTHSKKLKMQTSETVRLVDNQKVIVNLIENNGSKYFEWEDPIVLIKPEY